MINDELTNQIKEYGEKGYIKLSESPNMGLVKELFASISGNLSGQNLIPGFRSKTGAPKQYIDILSRYEREVFGVLPLNKIQNLAEGFYGAKKYAYITHSKLSLKEPFAESEWLPHQDNGYKYLLNSDPRRGFAVMLLLEATDESNGCLHIYEGSHKLGPVPHQKIVDDKKSGDYQLKLDMQIGPEFPDKPILGETGDCIVFDNNTVHYSMGSRVNSKRIVIIFEVALSDKIDLDDYGRVPFLLYGRLSRKDRIALSIKRMGDSRKYFYHLSRFSVLKKIYRSLFSKN